MEGFYNVEFSWDRRKAKSLFGLLKLLMLELRTVFIIKGVNINLFIYLNRRGLRFVETYY